MNLPLWLLVFLVDFYLGAQVYPADSKPKKASNRLIYGKSPHLLQHAGKAGSIRQKMPTVEQKKVFFSLAAAFLISGSSVAALNFLRLGRIGNIDIPLCGGHGPHK